MSVRAVDNAEAMFILGQRLGSLLERGDVLVLHGPLGAGKTTLARGIGDALDVEGAIQSPTFVVARQHRRKSSGEPPLVHIDAYRLSRPEELVDLDIDFDNSISLIEWGRPFVEKVASQWLDVDIQRPVSEEDDQKILSDEGSARIVTLTAHTRAGTPSTRFARVVEALRDSRD